MINLTPDERAVILRALDQLKVHTTGEQAIVESIRVKFGMPPADVGALSVDTLGLSVRAANALYNAGIGTIGEAAAKTDREYRRMPNVGVTTLREIREAIARAVARGAAP